MNNYDFMMYLYQNPEYLNYLRYHPKWYKVLYYEGNYDEFLRYVKKELQLRLTDKMENFKRNLLMLQSLGSYLGKK